MKNYKTIIQSIGWIRFILIYLLVFGLSNLLEPFIGFRFGIFFFGGMVLLYLLGFVNDKIKMFYGGIILNIMGTENVKIVKIK